MALPTTNLKFSQINAELLAASNSTRSMNNISTRVLASVGGTGVSFTLNTPISASQLKEHAYVSYSRTDGTNVNVYNDVASVEYVAGKTWIQYTLNGTIGSSTYSPALTISNFSSTDRVEVYNNASIQGLGGAGPGAASAAAGTPGGNALTVSCPVIITNNNQILGGGGGGGGGGNNFLCTPIPGVGGAGGNGQGYGQARTNGSPGSFGTGFCRGGNGGNGGDWGVTGGNGESGGAGGAAGTSVVGNAFITWVTTGTRIPAP